MSRVATAALSRFEPGSPYLFWKDQRRSVALPEDHVTDSD